jgi:hypothetical protein
VGSAESAAEVAGLGQIEDDLAEVVEAWAAMRDADRAAVLRIVREVVERGKR